MTETPEVVRMRVKFGLAQKRDVDGWIDQHPKKILTWKVQ